jgi:hypothetical protein
VTLYLKPRDPEAERWTGPREPISPDLQAKYGVDQIRRGKPAGALLTKGYRLVTKDIPRKLEDVEEWVRSVRQQR